MKLKVRLIDQWLAELEKLGHKVIGIYEQGSSVWGFADKDSDRDFIVVWEDEYPDRQKRQKVLESSGGKTHEFKDIPAVKKGVDMFESKDELLNVAHIKAHDFLGFYESLENLGSYYSEQLLRMGGFKNGKIHYDPEEKLASYRKKVELTPEIAKRVRNKIKDELEYDLRLLETASRRGNTLRFIHLLDEVLSQLHIWYYMEKNKWLMSDKWFEKFVKKYGWEDDFVELLREIKERLDLEELSGRLLGLSEKWDFKPSKKLKA